MRYRESNGRGYRRADVVDRQAMAPDAPHRRPGRPVADAPIERLLARPEDVARNWMFALLSQVELHQAPGVVTEPFTRDGPRVSDAALRALVEDADLRRLARDGALWPLVSRVGEMTGSPAPGHVLTAVDALHDVLWTELRGELRGAADPDLVADLAARLTRVCALIRDAGLMRAGGGGGLGLESVRRAAPPAEVEPPVDPGPGPGPGFDADPGPAAAQAAESVSAPEAEPVPAPRSPLRSTPLWVGALEDEIQAARAAFAPLSLLLTELEDADRIAAAAGSERAGEAFGEFSLAVRRALRGQDILVQETPSRAWVIARETARAGAHSLGARIAESVGETSSLSGTPLVASVGIAVLGEDGTECAQLTEAAEEARFAASARGIEVSRRMR
jgi:GGDEF domain-containing protein